MLSLALLALVIAEPEVVVVVGLGDPQALERRVHKAMQMLTAAGNNVMSLPQMSIELVGVAEPRVPDEKGIEQMLADARDREARFDTKGANDLRNQILRAFDASIRPTQTLRRLAATAAHDLAAAWLGEGQKNLALAAAREANRRFGAWPVDSTRHPPSVLKLFERARGGQQTGVLRVVSTTPGTVWVDGSSVGPLDGTVERVLPVGQYRVWLADAGGMASLPHKVELDASGFTLTIDMDLEIRLRVQPVITVECEATCAQDLRAIGQRLAASRVIGIPLPGRAAFEIDVATGESQPWTAAGDLEVVDVPLEVRVRDRFNPWYLVPFGIGQFVQDRPYTASAYATAQVGLLIWHVVASVRHTSAHDDADFSDEPELRAQRNISAGLFYGSLAASVLEALIVGWLTGE